MKFIDWFAGIGGFRRGMELAGHECAGFCENDKYAVMSYTSMHLITDEQREYLATLPLNQRQKEILKSEYRNGEWYADDIRTVSSWDIPSADCWCFGFPCQDISVCGKRKGFEGNRSSLFFRVMYLLGQRAEEERPTWLFIENVKNLISVNGGWDFARLLIEMDKHGYDAEWQLLNSADFGVPQHRERMFIIGHFRGRSGREVLPVAIPIKKVDGISEYKIHTITDPSRITRGFYPDDNGGVSSVMDITANTVTDGKHFPSVGTYVIDRQTDRQTDRQNVLTIMKVNSYSRSKEVSQKDGNQQESQTH